MPLPSLQRMFLFFFLYFLWDFWVLRDPTFSSKKNNKNKNPVVKGSAGGTLNTCAKFQGLALENGVDIWTFVRLSAKMTACHRNYLVLVYIRFWALNLNQYSSAVSSSNFCANFVKTCLGKKMGYFFFFLQ